MRRRADNQHAFFIFYLIQATKDNKESIRHKSADVCRCYSSIFNPSNFSNFDFIRS